MKFTNQEIEIICKRYTQIEDLILKIAREKAGKDFLCDSIEIKQDFIVVFLSDYSENKKEIEISFDELTEEINKSEENKSKLDAGFYFKIVCSCNYTEDFYAKFGQPFNFQCPNCGKLQGFIGRHHAN